MKNIFILIVAFFSICLIGCATGNFTYLPSNQTAFVKNSIEIDVSKDSTWNKVIAGLSFSPFVIKYTDKQSGFINVSYVGDPEPYIEGGELCCTFVHMNVNEVSRFPASRASAQYKIVSDHVYNYQRDVDLEARINISLSELSSSRTRLTVDAKYILSLKTTHDGVDPYQEIIPFNTDQSTLSKDSDEYRSNGKLEQMTLEIFK